MIICLLSSLQIKETLGESLLNRDFILDYPSRDHTIFPLHEMKDSVLHDYFIKNRLN